MGKLTRWLDRGTGGAAVAKSVLAASLPLEGPDKVRVGRNFKAGTDDWQKEAWYYYDAVGEFRSAVTWVANAVSKAEVHAAEIDLESGTVGEPTNDVRVQQIAAAVLGGMEQRPGNLKTLAVQWQVPGESFVIVRPSPDRAGTPQPDQWLVLSGRRVTYKGGSWSFTDPATLSSVTLTDSELLTRIWSPHPDDPVKADSAARPALPILREVEKATQHIAANLDSRLGTAGIKAIPSEMNFPHDDGTSMAESFTDFLIDVVEQGIKNPGAAAARVPVFVEMPGEMIPNFNEGVVDFATEFQSTVVDLRDSGLARLAATLDMPNETAEGSTGGMNHWGAWQVEEATYKIYIQPLLEALGNALTRDWFRPALVAAGVPNPDRFVLAWDTTGIISRPDRTGELKELWDDVLISSDYRRAQLGIPDDAIPSDEEAERRELIEMVKVAPSLLADPNIGQKLFGFEIAPAAVSVDPEAATTNAGDAAPDSTKALPAADDAGEPPQGLVAAAEFAVYDALARAGNRLLTREHRATFGQTRAEERYRTIPHTRTAEELLEGSFAFVSKILPEPEAEKLEVGLRIYTKYLIATLEPHSRELMARTIREALRP